MTPRTGPARAAMAEAVRGDMAGVTDLIDQALALLHELGADAGGLNGLAATCRGSIAAITAEREKLSEGAESVYELLTTRKPIAVQITATVDAEHAERVLEARGAA